MQAHAYEGYVEGGQFYPRDIPITLVGRFRAVLTVLDVPAQTDKSNEQNFHPTPHNSHAVIRGADPSRSALGLWEGDTIIPDDFNAPLEDLKEYMY